ncbi:hypothetical protein FRD01_06835 [Microvenator marinus]|uniref:Uncharacterized protein n=1 Tax=Microvenator marinus TaxID=2600177 RepID=A0A5B8XNZ1_9DELT|nr:hypothetical protein [Microvenator marinus]QED26961.1 hypothetical protein FRD01_06835 [Microvenator marinus]
MWISIEHRIEGGFLLSCSDHFPRTGALSFEFYRTRLSGEWLRFHRVFTRGKLATLIRLDDGCDWLYVGFDTFTSPLSPLKARHVEWCILNPETWLKEQLLAAGGIGPGVFSLTRVSGGEARCLAKEIALTQEPWFVAEAASLIPLRQSSDPEYGRVKWYRKLARSGNLPPVFLFRHDGLDSRLVFDGHDRLLAARLEGVFPHMWEISRVRVEDRSYPEEECTSIEANLAYELEKECRGKRRHEQVEAINQRLLELHSRQALIHRPTVRVIPGGLTTWCDDIDRLQLPNVFLRDE